MKEQAKALGDISILPPGETQLFSPQSIESGYKIIKGSASVQEWQRHSEGITHGHVVELPRGGSFVAGGGKEIFLLNLGKEPVKLRKFSIKPRA